MYYPPIWDVADAVLYELFSNMLFEIFKKNGKVGVGDSPAR